MIELAGIWHWLRIVDHVFVGFAAQLLAQRGHLSLKRIHSILFPNHRLYPLVPDFARTHYQGTCAPGRAVADRRPTVEARSDCGSTRASASTTRWTLAGYRQRLCLRIDSDATRPSLTLPPTLIASGHSTSDNAGRPQYRVYVHLCPASDWGKLCRFEGRLTSGSDEDIRATVTRAAPKWYARQDSNL